MLTKSLYCLLVAEKQQTKKMELSKQQKEEEAKEKKRLQDDIQTCTHTIGTHETKIKAEQIKIKETKNKIENLPTRCRQRRETALSSFKENAQKFIISWTKRRRASQWHQGKELWKQVFERIPEEDIQLYMDDDNEYDYTDEEGFKDEHLYEWARGQWQEESLLLFLHDEIVDTLKPFLGLDGLCDLVLFFLVPKGSVSEMRFLINRIAWLATGGLVSASPGEFTLQNISNTSSSASSSSSLSSSPPKHKTYTLKLEKGCEFVTESQLEQDEDTDTDNNSTLEMVVSANGQPVANMTFISPMQDSDEPESAQGWGRYDNKIGRCNDSIRFHSFSAAEHYRLAFEDECSRKAHTASDSSSSSSSLSCSSSSSLYPSDSTSTAKEEKKQVVKQEETKKEKVPVKLGYEDDVATCWDLENKPIGFIDPYNLRVYAQHPDIDAILFSLIVRRFDHTFTCPAVPRSLVEPFSGLQAEVTKKKRSRGTEMDTNNKKLRV